MNETQIRPDGSAIRKTEMPTPCLSVFLTGRADICDGATNKQRGEHICDGATKSEQGRGRISGRKQTQIKSIEETKAPQRHI